MSNTNNKPTNVNEAIAIALRFERAKQIIEEGYTFSLDTDTGVVSVCKPGQLSASYFIGLFVSGCDCPDATNRQQPCKHELAWLLVREARMLEAQWREYEIMEEGRGVIESDRMDREVREAGFCI
jgi:uncharacterized Zn finger protein